MATSSPRSIAPTRGSIRGSIHIERERSVHTDTPSPLAALRRAAETDTGHTLPEDIQREWGARLDDDLSDFRVHTDASTSAAVEASGANALSHGRDLFFASGRYRPESEAGRALLGHEIAHGVQTRRGPAPLLRTATRSLGVESEADSMGARLAAGGGGPLALGHANLAPGLRGDKQISFSGRTITVRDTYLIYGPGVSPGFLSRFRSALDRYYNSPEFRYRGYRINFELSVREKTDTDSSGDSSTSIFEVETGSGRAGGIFEITLYETSSEGTIAHEVGHYLSDRVGYFSEGYTESPVSRLGSLVGLSDTHTEVRPEATYADGSVDIMARTGTGVVGEFSLGGILDAAIDRHEREERFNRELRGVRRAFSGDPASAEWFIRRLSGF
ncbi:MAG: DUF4157 domain-containing protein [Enhygromyxa sp.]